MAEAQLKNLLPDSPLQCRSAEQLLWQRQHHSSSTCAWPLPGLLLLLLSHQQLLQSLLLAASWATAFQLPWWRLELAELLKAHAAPSDLPLSWPLQALAWQWSAQRLLSPTEGQSMPRRHAAAAGPRAMRSLAAPQAEGAGRPGRDQAQPSLLPAAGHAEAELCF